MRLICWVPQSPGATAPAAYCPQRFRYRVWQRRFVPFHVYTEKKRLQKLDYMHQNIPEEDTVYTIV
jgi:hypothetical protein